MPRACIQPETEAQTPLYLLHILPSSRHFSLPLLTFADLLYPGSPDPKQAVSRNCLACGQDVKYFKHLTHRKSGQWLHFTSTLKRGPNGNKPLITALLPG